MSQNLSGDLAEHGVAKADLSTDGIIKWLTASSSAPNDSSHAELQAAMVEEIQFMTDSNYTIVVR